MKLLLSVVAAAVTAAGHEGSAGHSASSNDPAVTDPAMGSHGSNMPGHKEEDKEKNPGSYQDPATQTAAPHAEASVEASVEASSSEHESHCEGPSCQTGCADAMANWREEMRKWKYMQGGE